MLLDRSLLLILGRLLLRLRVLLLRRSGGSVESLLRRGILSSVALRLLIYSLLVGLLLIRLLLLISLLLLLLVRLLLVRLLLLVLRGCRLLVHLLLLVAVLRWPRSSVLLLLGRVVSLRRLIICLGLLVRLRVPNRLLLRVGLLCVLLLRSIPL